MSLFKKQVPVRIEAQVTWHYKYDAEARVYMGICPALNLNAIGDTWIDFQDCVNDAMGALFRDLFRDGEFEQFMRSKGWQSGPLPVGATPRFDIPYDTRQTQELSANLA
jgi:hypothetical protein